MQFYDSTQLEVESILKVTWRMNCSEAHTKEMVLSKVNVVKKIPQNTKEVFFIFDYKDLRKALKWVPGRRILK